MRILVKALLGSALGALALVMAAGLYAETHRVPGQA
jgi:hypothetical protein